MDQLSFKYELEVNLPKKFGHGGSRFPPERIRIKGSWKKAVKQALRKKKPAGGWPKK